jgi:hypothetical protein
MNRPKQKGTAWETAIINFLHKVGVMAAERRALKGIHDRGDVAGIPHVVIEAKAEARFNLSGWLDEAEKERRNAGAEIGVVWFKRRGRSSAGAGYVLMDGFTLVKLLADGGHIPPLTEVDLDAGDTPRR